MSNPDDLSTFEQGVDAWNVLVEKRLRPGGADRSSWRYVADLSHEWIGLLRLRRVDLEEGRRLRDLLWYPEARFNCCDLRGTNFDASYGNFNFRAANFTLANLRDANLTAADLKDAWFVGAELQGAVLRGARLDGAHLAEADLTGTDLTATSPWKARLFMCDRQTGAITPPSATTVTSIADLISICADLHRSSSGHALRFYYRGQTARWKLRPSLMRARHLRNREGAMLTELITRRPHDFGEASSALDQWVLAQHHRLKTRLLDVTTNPLVALFFACEQDEQKDNDGRLDVFAVPSSLMKSYNSDSISIVANFAKLGHGEQNTLLGKRRGATSDYNSALRKLYHLIGEEKPHFQRRIDPRDLFRVFVVQPRHTFERLSAQSGAFFISAFHERFEQDVIRRWNDGIPVYEHFALTVPAERKHEIMSELDILNTTRDTLFPSLDEVASAVIDHHDIHPPPPGQGHVKRNRTWHEEHQIPRPRF